MKKLLALTILITGCATFPPPEPCRICDASTAPRHDAPVRLWHPEIPTPCGIPHPGWSLALRQRMQRERQLNPTQTPMDREFAYPTQHMHIPTGIERELLLAKPKIH